MKSCAGQKVCVFVHKNLMPCWEMNHDSLTMLCVAQSLSWLNYPSTLYVLKLNIWRAYEDEFTDFSVTYSIGLILLSCSRTSRLIHYWCCSHQNAIVRTACARLLVSLVSKVGVDKVMTQTRDMRDKILIAGSNLLTEGSLDTR